MSRPFALALIILILVAAPPIRAAESRAEAFRREWQGRTVSVQRTLITMVYDERGRIGATYRGNREGLTVTTPTKGYYYLFPGRISFSTSGGSSSSSEASR